MLFRSHVDPVDIPVLADIGAQRICAVKLLLLAEGLDRREGRCLLRIGGRIGSQHICIILNGGSRTVHRVHRKIDVVVVVEVHTGEPVARSAVIETDVESQLRRAFHMITVPVDLIFQYDLVHVVNRLHEVGIRRIEIGRASCRERV